MLYVLVVGGLMNAIAMTIAWRSNLYAKHQKIAQTVLIWLLPVVGSTVVLLAQGSLSRRPVPDDGFTPLRDSNVDHSGF